MNEPRKPDQTLAVEITLVVGLLSILAALAIPAFIGRMESDDGFVGAETTTMGFR